MAKVTTIRPLVILRWDDAHAYDSEMEESEINHQAIPITTYGLLLRDDEIGVSIANEQTSETTYRGHTFVPRAMVRSVQVLRKQPQRQPRRTRVVKEISG